VGIAPSWAARLVRVRLEGRDVLVLVGYALDSARQGLATMKSDPATWNKNITSLQATLTNLAAQLGAMPTRRRCTPWLSTR